MWNLLAEKTLRDELFEVILKNVSKKARPNAELGSSLRDLGIDSLGTVMLVMKLCAHFKVDARSLAGDIGQLRTIGDLVDIGERVLGKNTETSNTGKADGPTS